MKSVFFLNLQKFHKFIVGFAVYIRNRKAQQRWVATFSNVQTQTTQYSHISHLHTVIDKH